MSWPNQKEQHALAAKGIQTKENKLTSAGIKTNKTSFNISQEDIDYISRHAARFNVKNVYNAINDIWGEMSEKDRIEWISCTSFGSKYAYYTIHDLSDSIRNELAESLLRRNR